MAQTKLTVAEAQAQHPQAMQAWDPGMGDPADADIFTDGETLLADADCPPPRCHPPGRKHPHVWCPEIGEWDPL